MLWVSKFPKHAWFDPHSTPTVCSTKYLGYRMCVKLQDKRKKNHIFTSSSPRCHERQPPRVRTWGPMELRGGFFIALTLLYFWAASFAPNSAIEVPQFTFSSDEMTSPTGWQLLGLNSKFPEEWKVLWVWRMEQKKEIIQWNLTKGRHNSKGAAVNEIDVWFCRGRQIIMHLPFHRD